MAGESVWISPAVLAAAVAAGAAWLSYRKLKLDLFEKRYRLYREVIDQSFDYMGHLNDSRRDAAYVAAQRAFWRAGEEMRFLFGPLVEHQVKALDQAFRAFAAAIASLKTAQDRREGFLDAENAVMARRRDILLKIDSLSEACYPFLLQGSSFWKEPECFIEDEYRKLKAFTRALYASVKFFLLQRIKSLKAKRPSGG